MSDAWLAISWIAVFLIIGATISVTAMARARKSSGETGAIQAERYRELAAKSADAQERLSEELASMNDRVAKIEELLRVVG
ncbi:MAG: hypothetical protein ACRDZM_09305 [Acidimicrobiia bacterium]